MRIRPFIQPEWSTWRRLVLWTGLVLIGFAAAGQDPVALPSPAATNLTPPALPVLTTAGAVRRLKRGEARRGYPFKIQGVVTCIVSKRQAFVVQDSTTGLYIIDDSTESSNLPPVGEMVEVEGMTSDLGVVKAREVRRLGAGQLPEPALPNWDQLENGSLDSQWVEIRGVIESMRNRPNGWAQVALRTRNGVLSVELRRDGVQPGPLEQYENAVIRLRGCLFAGWDNRTLRVKVGQIRMSDVEVMVDEPAPADLFAIPTRTTESLMHFDPEFDVFHRVKVAGQIVYVRGWDYFMMDGTNGLRFEGGKSLGLNAGDQVEVVGFPLLSGAAPFLHGAVARKTGEAPLPKPRKLLPDDLVNLGNDSTRVRVDGVLSSLRETATNLVMEIQAGSWRFLARLNATGEPFHSLRIGSRLELTGVYCAQGGYEALGADVVPLDLLLGSPADIQILSVPSWWTLPRLLVVVGVLACVMAVMLLWITQLRRQVEERTAELGSQIQNRQNIEHQQAMEQERARIAQDLHDELGSDITEIGMLAARAKSLAGSEDERRRYLEQMGDKAREMVSILDEIVWAMNPLHDSLSSLTSYFCFYAENFLQLANIHWQFDGPAEATDCRLDSRCRHQLFLAFKEALTNVVRHSGATEVRLGIQMKQGELQLSIADNGHGLPPDARPEAMNGVANMRRRIEKLGGRFEIVSDPGPGTTVRLCVPAR